MKKFIFPLQKLLEYKEQVLNNETYKMSDLQEEYNALFDLQEKYTQSYNEEKQNFLSATQAGLSINQIMYKKNFIHNLYQNIENIKVQISEQQKKIDRQMDVMIAIKRDISAVEKLKEKQYEEYKKAENKVSELLIDEFVTNQSARQSG